MPAHSGTGVLHVLRDRERQFIPQLEDVKLSTTAQQRSYFSLAQPLGELCYITTTACIIFDLKCMLPLIQGNGISRSLGVREMLYISVNNMFMRFRTINEPATRLQFKPILYPSSQLLPLTLYYSCAWRYSRGMMPRVTISDVAREAKVSTMTVSRVVNKKGEISQATRERVELAIQQLGYRPNRLARALSLQKTQTVGMVVPDINNPFFSEIIRGAEDEAWERGYSLVLGSTVESLEREARTLELLEEKHVDGVIVCSPRLPDAQLFELLGQHRSALLLNRTAPAALAGTIGVDDTHGAMRATHHLLGRGCRAIGLVAGPEASHSRRRREAGYRTALETTGHEVILSRIVLCAPDEAGGFEATQALLEAHPEIDGLFCYNDLVAVGALQACSALGLHVPKDVAVVGCDDIRLASLVTPALTTLRVDKQALGRRAVTLLLERHLSPRDTQSDMVVTLKPELVVRASAP